MSYESFVGAKTYVTLQTARNIPKEATEAHVIDA